MTETTTDIFGDKTAPEILHTGKALETLNELSPQKSKRFEITQETKDNLITVLHTAPYNYADPAIRALEALHEIEDCVYKESPQTT